MRGGRATTAEALAAEGRRIGFVGRRPSYNRKKIDGAGAEIITRGGIAYG